MRKTPFATLLPILLLALPLRAEIVTLTAEMDAAVSAANPTTNYGTTGLVIGNSSGQPWHSLLRFHLGELPGNPQITGGEIVLTGSNLEAGGTLRVSRPQAGWTEAAVTWANQPESTTLAEIVLVPDGPETATLPLTEPVLAYLQDVANNAAVNRGLKLEIPAATANQYLNIESRESGADGPRLRIHYTPGPELPSFTAALNPLADRLRAELAPTPEGSPTPFELLWNTKPGVRYRLWESANLDDWSVASGYPLEADGLSALHEVPLVPPARFFMVEALDEQPPEIVSRFPEDGSFGIKRFYPGHEIAIRLSDVSGVDPASISMTVGALGTFSVSDEALSYGDGLLTLDLGGDTALGAYGAQIAVSLTVADVLGTAATYDWSFELEREIVLADGLFTFGSPEAQRSGQRVPAIPTRILAERAGGGGPIRMNDAEWTLETVNADSLVIAYTGASAPVFAIDQYLTNMTPARVDEIFYRRVTSINDDPVGKELTLGTVDVAAWEIMQSGSASLTNDDVAFEVDDGGRIIRPVALEVVSGSGKFKIRPFGINLGGKTVMGVYQKPDSSYGFSFGLPIENFPPSGGSWKGRLHLKQAQLSIQPTVSVAVDFRFFTGLERFHSESTVAVDSILEARAEFAVPGLSIEFSSENETTHEPLIKQNIIIPLGATPLWLDVSPRLRIEGKVEAGVTGSLSAGVSGGYSTTTTIDYEKDRETPLQIEQTDSDSYFDLIEPELLFGGTLSMGLKVKPELDVKLNSLVGFYVNLSPGYLAEASANLNSGTLVGADFTTTFDCDLNVGMSIFGVDQSHLPAFEPWEVFKWQRRWAFPDVLDYTPLAILVQPQSQTVQPGGNINLSVQANHSEGVTYEWRHNGRRLFNDSPTLRITSASSAFAGDYQVKLTRLGQSVMSEAVVVSVGNRLMFAEHFDGTSGINWEFFPASSGSPGSAIAGNGILHILRTNSTGSGGGVGLRTNVDIPVTESTYSVFSLISIFSNVRNGTGDSNWEYPANVRLKLQTSEGERSLRFSYSHINSDKPNVAWSTGYQVSNTRAIGWMNDQTYRIREYFPTATRILQIHLEGAGWNFESKFSKFEVRN